MKNADQYLTHSAGIYALLAWNEEQQQSGTPTKISKQTVYVHPLTSRFFALGISKKKNTSKIPFLAIQPNEAYWMRLIQWDKAYIRDRDMHLYLVSKVIKGDNENYPDIPAFAIALSFDTIDKINLLKRVNNIEGREYREDNGQIMINFHGNIFNMPVTSLPKDAPYLDDGIKITNYNDIMLEKEHKLQSVFSTDAPPEFLGDVNEATSIATKYWKNLTDLLDKTKPKK
jgi:hypothetical protein